jgi:hypothetical protein
MKIRLNAMGNLFLMLDFLDGQLVQSNLTSDLLTTGSILGTGLISKETVNLKAIYVSQTEEHTSEEPLCRNSPLLMSCS